MQLIDLTPKALAEWPGFTHTVQCLRDEAELELFATQETSFNVEAYQELYTGGHLRCVAVIEGEAELLGWGILLTVGTPRREGALCTTDAIWCKQGTEAGAAILRAFIGHANYIDAPLFVTAAAGGRLDATLSKHTRTARKTHHVYCIDPR